MHVSFHVNYIDMGVSRIKWPWQRTGIQLVSGKIEDLCRICQKEKKEP
jgi:hypothetical protein